MVRPTRASLATIVILVTAGYGTGCSSYSRSNHIDRAFSGGAPDAVATFSVSSEEVADVVADVLGEDNTFVTINSKGAAEIAWGSGGKVFADNGGIGVAIPLRSGRTRLELTGFSAAGGAERVMLAVQRRIE